MFSRTGKGHIFKFRFFKNIFLKLTYRVQNIQLRLERDQPQLLPLVHRVKIG